MKMRLILILLALFLSACSLDNSFIKPQHLDIQQGNVVTSQMMLKLKPGMTKSQVRFVLGTPLLQDIYHQNRWDYIYEMRKGDKLLERRRIVLEFSEDQLKTVRGDIIPAGSPGAENAPVASVVDLKTVKSDKTLLQEESQTHWYDGLKFWGDDKNKSESVAVAAEAETQSSKPATPSTASQKEDKSWYDHLKFWESDDKPASTLSPSKPMHEIVVDASKPPEVTPMEKSEPAPKKIAEQPETDLAKAGAKESAKPSVKQEPEVAVVEKSDIPAPKQVAATPAKNNQSANPSDAVMNAIAKWANGWRTRNLNDYLDSYSPKFQPEGFSKNVWLEQRKQRVGAKRDKILLELENIDVTVNGNQAIVTFSQHYASGGFSDNVDKQLELSFENGRWLITRELVNVKGVGKKAKASNLDDEVYEKPREVTADERGEAMPEKLIEESAKSVGAPVTSTSKSPDPVPVETVPSAPSDAVVQSPDKKHEDALPNEDAPDYFERLIERIGF
jgi:outer membrane protein assembly factor BamE (lipoprotein component of BamABCDE complex)